jgi:hypothetical protein
MNRLTRNQTLGRAAGLVSVTREIAHLPANAVYHKATSVIANGIDLDEVETLLAPNNPTPRLGFVGSPGYNWHGVDKLPELALRCPDLTIDVIGYQPGDLAKTLPPNLRLHGFLSREQVRERLAQMDVSFGSLALHRVPLEEACPLKVRESLGYGIPIILGFEDTDLSGAGFDFILQLPNREDNLAHHAEEIRTFAYAMRGKRANREALRPLIDQQVKEEQRLAFFAALRG